MNLGKYMPASFPIPQNPLMAGMGKFMPAKYPVPQNPLIEAMLPRPNNVVLANLTGCGSTIPGDVRGCRGIGYLGAASSTAGTFHYPLSFAKNNWMILAGAAVAGAVIAGYVWFRPKKPETKSNPRRRRR